MDGATVDRCPDVPDPRGGVHVEQSHCDRVLEHLPESAEQIVSRQRRQLLRLANFEAHNPDEHEKISDPFSAQGGDTRAELSWGERAAQARAHIDQIDAELERVNGGDRQ